jgi:hypothetical protein
VVLAALCFMGSAVSLMRRVQEAAPEETGSLQAMAVLGAPQTGVLQAESWIAEEESGNHSDIAGESSSNS